MSSLWSMTAEPSSAKRCRTVQVVKVHPAVLHVETLIVVLQFLKRRELDSGTIACRRFRTAVGCITDILRVVSSVSFGLRLETDGFRFAYVLDEMLQQRNTRSGRLQSMIELELTDDDIGDLLDLFINSLRYYFISSEIIMNGITFDAQFAARLESISGKCVISNLRLIDVRMGNDVTLLDIFRRLPAFDLSEPQTLQLEGTAPRCTIKRVPINDETLKWLASSGIWYHGGNIWPTDGVTEDGILDYFFGDYPNDDADKDLQVDKPGVSQNFINVFLEARRNSPKTFHFRLKLHDVRITDFDLTAIMQYKSRFGSDYFHLPKSTGVDSVTGSSADTPYVVIRSWHDQAQFAYRR
ncbi:hypothetical protein AAVH_14533 [Aphelenchoides avenae]|nr:hypothetical protein AAVH_14533 [Aphelenchus avenae]